MSISFSLKVPPWTEFWSPKLGLVMNFELWNETAEIVHWWCSYALEVHFDTKQLSCQVKSAQLLSGVSIFGFTIPFFPLAVRKATNSFRLKISYSLLMLMLWPLPAFFNGAIMTKCRKQLTFSMNFLFKATKLTTQPKFCQNDGEKSDNKRESWVTFSSQTRAPHFCC